MTPIRTPLYGPGSMLADRISPQEASRLVGHHDPEPEAVQRARAQAKYSTDPQWGEQLIARAVRESAT